MKYFSKISIFLPFSVFQIAKGKLIVIKTNYKMYIHGILINFDASLNFIFKSTFFCRCIEKKIFVKKQDRVSKYN